MALDPDHRLVVAAVPGRRTAESVEPLVGEFHRRISGRPMSLITTDEYAPYREAIPKPYGETVTPPAHREAGPARKPYQVASAGLLYATVHKNRREGRVVGVEPRLAFGTEAALKAALARSSRAVNTSFVERQNGTDRSRNARKVRKAYSFSKRWDVHEAATYFIQYSYNFCWPVRTLADLDDTCRIRRRPPAMSAGLADHVWPLREWLALPAVKSIDSPSPNCRWTAPPPPTPASSAVSAGRSRAAFFLNYIAAALRTCSVGDKEFLQLARNRSRGLARSISTH